MICSAPLIRRHPRCSSPMMRSAPPSTAPTRPTGGRGPWSGCWALWAIATGRFWTPRPRPAPLHAALHRLHQERGAERFPAPARVLVDAADLDAEEKVLILFRHAKA